MKRGVRRWQWTALALAMLLSLVLISLGAFGVRPGMPSKSGKSVLLSASLIDGDGATAIRIMPLGDSITYGQGSTDYGGYRLPLWHDLSTLRAHITFVGSVQKGPADFPNENEGHPGWTIRRIAAQVVSWLQTYQPQVILLHIGTNDIVKNDDPEHATARLQGLIEQITSTLPDATLIVAQIIPLGRNPQWNAEVVNYNRAIPGIVQAEAAKGRHVQSVDMYDVVSPTLLGDGIHPDGLAYTLMAQVWANALVPLIKLAS